MESRPRHHKTPKDTELYLELKQLVDQKLKELPTARLSNLKIKLLIYPFLYSSFYYFALKNASNFGLFMLFYGFMGITAVIIFCELIHELAHNNVFTKAQYNKLALKFFDILGANSYLWQQRHLKLHHHFPNVNGWDADIEQKGPVTIFPGEQRKKTTRYQHKYVFFLYPLFMLNWLLIRDFRDYFSKNRIVRKCINIPRVEYYKLFFFKFLYLFIILGIPVFFLNIPVVQALCGLVMLCVSGSLLAMIILLTPHVNSGNEFPKAEEGGVIKMTWLEHQLISTNDIDNSNWITRNIMGNFNFHIAHHLFPKISSVYAPEITEVVKSFCLKNNLPYKSYPISVAFKKHYELIRKNALEFSEMDI